MEQQIKIKIPGTKKYIYGVLRGSVRQPLVILVHGLTGHRDAHIFYNGARFLERHGFSSFRFNLYDFAKDARKLDECTLQTHADDLDAVVAYFRKNGVRKICVIGHSYGGPTILLSRKKDFDVVVLWDPTYGKSVALKKDVVYLRGLRKYYLAGWSCKIMVGKEMVDFSEKVSDMKSNDWIASMHVPVKIILAEKSMHVERGRGYYAPANQPKAFAIVKNADHCFNTDGTEEQLFKETLSWIRKYA